MFFDESPCVSIAWLSGMCASIKKLKVIYFWQFSYYVWTCWTQTEVISKWSPQTSWRSSTFSKAPNVEHFRDFFTSTLLHFFKKHKYRQLDWHGSEKSVANWESSYYEKLKKYKSHFLLRTAVNNWIIVALISGKMTGTLLPLKALLRIKSLNELIKFCGTCGENHEIMRFRSLRWVLREIF